MYRSSELIENTLRLWGDVFIPMTHIPLENSVNGRPISALRLRIGPATQRRRVLLMAGLHGREVLNPDILIDFVVGLINHLDTDWVIDRTRWTAALIRMLAESLDIYILPNANPDGRERALTSDSLWRKNMRYHFRPYPETSCTGTDINRNFDFFPSTRTRDNAGNWTSSGYHCDPTYKGPSPFFEPETRNVRTLLEAHGIDFMVDLHSAGEKIMYPWGHAPLQTTDPSQNLASVSTVGWNILPDDAPDYREYMPPGDLNWFQKAGQRISNAIRDCRPDETVTVDTGLGRVSYKVQRNYDVIPIQEHYTVVGSSVDYAYARHIVNPDARKVMPLAIETGDAEFGNGFHPVPNAAKKITEEIHCGLLAFLQTCVCGVEQISLRAGLGSQEMRSMRRMRDERLMSSPAGRDWIELLERHQLDVLRHLNASPKLQARAAELVCDASGLLAQDQEVPQAVAERIQGFLKGLQAERLSAELSEAVQLLSVWSATLAGRRVNDIVEELTKRSPRECAGSPDASAVPSE